MAENKNKTYIGIDPGVSTGLAAWSKNQNKLIFIATLNFWSAIEFIRQWVPTDTVIIIEDPNQNRPTFNRFNSASNATDRKISQNVGSNKRDAQLLIEYCEINGFEVIKRKPGPKSGSKIKEDQFKKYTGYTGRTSQHGRDAAMLVFGL